MSDSPWTRNAIYYAEVWQKAFREKNVAGLSITEAAEAADSIMIDAVLTDAAVIGMG